MPTSQRPSRPRQPAPSLVDCAPPPPRDAPNPADPRRPVRAAPTLSVLVPVFNECRTLPAIIEKLRATPFPCPVEFVIVDDGSTDGSRELLAEMPPSHELRILIHERNSGKGAAVQTALDHARGEFVVIQDADLELEPADILPLLAVVRSGRAAACFGSRFMRDNRDWFRLPTYWANRLLTLVCNLLNRRHLTDMNTCYKLMRTDLARRIRLESRGFAMEPEITTKLIRMGVAIAERPIRYRPRGRHEGKKIRAADLGRYLAAMLRFRFLEWFRTAPVGHGHPPPPSDPNWPR